MICDDPRCRHHVPCPPGMEDAPYLRVAPPIPVPATPYEAPPLGLVETAISVRRHRIHDGATGLMAGHLCDDCLRARTK